MFLRIVLIGSLTIAAAGCGQSTPATTTPTPAPATGSGASVSIVVNARTLTTGAFNPNPITIAHGSSVTWMNNDTITHTSTSDNGMWNSGGIAPGGSFTTTFATAGTFTYHCSLHPNMVGTVTVH